MSARDEILRIILGTRHMHALHLQVPADIVEHVGNGIADAILAAGYSMPRTITSQEELDALEDGSAVLDADADVSTKHAGKWHGYEMAPLDSRKFSKCGPFTILYEPKSA